MNKEENNISLRSEEVQEIMGEVPAKIVRWGTTIFFLILIILLAGSYYFKFPEVVKSDIQVTIMNNKIISNVGLSSFGAGKIKAGQKVLIGLKSFPEHEFGYLEGVIKSISYMELDNGNYNASIIFKNNLKTNHGYNLPSDGIFEGKATIITKDTRLLERIISTINRK